MILHYHALSIDWDKDNISIVLSFFIRKTENHLFVKKWMSAYLPTKLLVIIALFHSHIKALPTEVVIALSVHLQFRNLLSPATQFVNMGDSCVLSDRIMLRSLDFSQCLEKRLFAS